MDMKKIYGMYRMIGMVVVTVWLLSVPVSVHAASCSANGYTVVFVNGVSTTKSEADAARISLQEKLKFAYKGQPLTVTLAYNAQHLAGAADIVEAVSQMMSAPLSDYDLHAALRQMSGDVTTRKLIVLGYSQGALYANSMYDYLTANGEPKSSLSIYAVATPASYVAGGGTYTTSNLDAVILGVTAAAKKVGIPAPLPADAALSVYTSDPLVSHQFDTYINGASDKIVSDIDAELDQLKPDWPSDTEPCFFPPDMSASDNAQQTFFTVADPIASVMTISVVATAQTTVSVVKTAYAAVSNALAAVANVLKQTVSNPASPANTAKNFNVVNKLYGSSVDSSEGRELMGNNQGAAVALALNDQAPALDDKQQNVISTAPAVVASTTIILDATSATSTSTSVLHATTTLPVAAYSGGGGGANRSSPPPEQGTDSDSSQDTTATETPYVPPILFDASTAPPVLSVDGCAANPCTVSITAITLHWTTPTGTVASVPSINSIPQATTTASSTTLTLADMATSTVTITVYDASSTPLTSATTTIYVLTPPPPFTPHGFFSDTLDNFDTSTWFTFGGSAVNFIQATDTDNGPCVSGNCILGYADSSDIPRTYHENAANPLTEGSFTVYAKAQNGAFHSLFPVFSICSANSACVDGTGRLDIVDAIQYPFDDVWHKYAIFWRQGTSHVETCVLTDSTDVRFCIWKDSGAALGITYDALALWSTNGYRSDLGEKIWFDEVSGN